MAVFNNYNDDSRSTIYNTSWASPAFFKLSVLRLNSTSLPATIYENSVFGVNNNAKTPLDINELLGVSIVSINTPNISSQPIHEWVGGTWVYTNGRPEMRQIDITFKDTDKFMFWKSFTNVYNNLTNRYPNECKWDLILKSIPMHLVLRNDDTEIDNMFSTIVETNDAILTSISPIQMSQDNSDSFATFTVTFMYHIQKHNDLKI